MEKAVRSLELRTAFSFKEFYQHQRILLLQE